MIRGKKEKGFTLIELLIVVAVIGVIAAIALPYLLQTKISANESAAISNIRTIASAEALYWNAHHIYVNLPGLESDGLIDEVFGTGNKQGYSFTPAGTINEYEYSFQADPLSTETGIRHFFIDETMTLRVSMSGPANSSSPPLD